MKSLITLVTAATLAAGVFTTAQADTSNEFRTETVRYADLDTAHAEGAARLYKRTRYAAERVCRNLDPARASSLMEPYRACVQLALSNAIAEIDQPAVSAYAASRGVALVDNIKIARRN